MSTKFRTILKQEFIPISADRLIVGTKLPFEVYVKEDGIVRILFNSGTDYTKIQKKFLIDRGLYELYISDGDKEVFDAYNSKSNIGSASVLDSPKAFKDYTFHKDNHYQIDKGMLIAGTSVPFSIYSMKNYAYAQVLQASPEHPMTIGDEIVSVAGDVLISKSDLPLYNEYLNSVLQSVAISPKDRERMQALAIKENSKIIVKDLFDDPRSGEKIKAAQNSVNNMIDSITRNKETIHDLLSLRGFDYYTYTHSVNVGVLSIGLGLAAGLGREEVEKLGIGALLHDIGKSIIPSEILNKQGKLDDREFIIIQSHVFEGEKILMDNGRVPKEALPAVVQHHEKITGRGYPFHLAEKEITLFGRITAIADCYDALTTTRPYRQALTPFYALGTISKETGNYDAELLKVFIKMLGKV